MLNPSEVIEKIEIQPGATIADFGCGSGFFALELAKKTGNQGKVFAIDILPTALESVRSLAKVHKVSNIETRWANLEKTSTLDDESCNFVLISNILFQIDKKFWPKVVGEIKRILKPDGQVLFIDWKEDSPLGPPKAQRISQDKLFQIAKESLNFLKDFSLGDTHWGIIFKK